ncbi:MAG: 4Fe-4S binding protein [Acidobacteriia bacterium]|nr:4Fe-4S binding protein [Terriglobia bacterium]
MNRLIVFALALVLLVLPSAFAHETATTTGHGQVAKASPIKEPPPLAEHQVLYWYDPMHPAYKLDRAGIAPDCGMELVPRYAGEPEVPIQPVPMFHPWWTLGAMVFLTGLTVALLFTRGSPRPRNQGRFDLLQFRGVKALVKWRYFQLILQVPNLLIFALVIYLGFFDTQDGGRNFATKMTWTIWWAAIIFAFVLVGRLWCTMCPFGALTVWTSRIFKPIRRFPPALRNVWLATLAFVILTWADEYFGIVGSPSRTAWLVVVISTVAILTGLFFQRATFCRHLCPIGGLIGLYSMVSPLELRAKNRAACSTCLTKDCYRGNEKGEGCMMFEFPSAMDRNNYCNLCGECVKTCPKDNISFTLRPFAEDLWSSSHRRFDEAFLAILLVGVVFMVTGHMVEPWHAWMDRMSHFIPFSLVGIKNHAMIENLTFTVVYFVSSFLVAPLLVLLASQLSRGMVHSPRFGYKETFTIFGYMFVPIGLALHLAHNVLHLLKEGPGIVPVIQRTINDLTVFHVGTANWRIGPLATDVFIYYLQMSILSGFYLLSLYIGWKLSLRNYRERKLALRAVFPMMMIAAAFTFLNVYLLSQPMSARHHH